MGPLELVKLPALMERNTGKPEVSIGLIDGPVATQHPDLTSEYLREMSGKNGATCTQANRIACLHGTFVARILFAKRNSLAPAICPNCTLLAAPFSQKRLQGTNRCQARHRRNLPRRRSNDRMHGTPQPD